MPWNHEAVNSTQNINTQTSTFHVTTYFEVYPIRTVQTDRPHRFRGKSTQACGSKF